MHEFKRLQVGASFHRLTPLIDTSVGLAVRTIDAIQKLALRCSDRFLRCRSPLRTARIFLSSDLYAVAIFIRVSCAYE